jgi:MoaA/NifB/PqqE/SkfB family radical SAM enzyme
MTTYLPFLPRTIKRKGLPLYLIFYVTARCNQKCEHCFYWQRLNKKQKELSLKEIEKISESMGPLLWLSLTGGEPFLRSDLAKIVKIFVKNNQVRHVSIPTNGSLAKRIVAGVKTMVSQNPKTTFSISLSCDGPEKIHDQIRGVRGSFRAALKTAKELKKLKEKHRNLGLGMTMTLTKTNQDQFLKTYRFLRNKVGPDEIFINLVRGKPKNPETAKVDMRIYERAVKQKMEDIKKGR